MTYEQKQDIAKFLEPTEIGSIINPCCGDIYYKIWLDNKYGKDNVERMIAEYRRNER